MELAGALVEQVAKVGSRRVSGGDGEVHRRKLYGSFVRKRSAGLKPGRYKGLLAGRKKKRIPHSVRDDNFFLDGGGLAA